MIDLNETGAALHTLATCLDTLTSINAGNILLPGGPQERYHQILEEAYVALGRLEAVVEQMSQELEEQHRRLDEARDDALSAHDFEDRTMRLTALLQWEQVYAWAVQHTSSSWAGSYSGYPAHGDFLGQSGSPLLSPLACYLNETRPSVPFHREWRIARPEYQAWHSSDSHSRYPLPAWARTAERLTDAIQGTRRGRGKRPAFLPAWITQEQWLAILEQVKPEGGIR